MSTQLEIITSQAESEDLEQKEAALEMIGQLLDSRELNRDERVVVAGVLEDLGLFGTGILTQSRRMNLQSLEMIRFTSAVLLGQLGYEESARVLIKMLQYDDSTLVLAQCAQSCGAILPTVDLEAFPQGDLLMIRQMSDTMKEQFLHRGEGHYALAFLDAVEAMGDHDQNLFSYEYMIDQVILVSLSESGYNRQIRNKANDLLDKIQGVNRVIP